MLKLVVASDTADSHRMTDNNNNNNNNNNNYYYYYQQQQHSAGFIGEVHHSTVHLLTWHCYFQFLFKQTISPQIL